jgi:hypothetical protein
MVTLFVGPARKKFVVYRGLLVKESQYFRSALGSHMFKEAVEGVMTLEEDDPDAFRLLISWVYRRYLPVVQPFVHKPDFNSQQNGSQPSAGDREQTPPLTIGVDGGVGAVPENTANVRVEPEYSANMDVEEEDGTDGDGVRGNNIHLSFRPTYNNFSREEIKLADYEALAVRRRANQHFPITSPKMGKTKKAPLQACTPPSANVTSGGLNNDAATASDLGNNWTGPAEAGLKRTPTKESEDEEHGTEGQESRPERLTGVYWHDWRGSPNNPPFTTHERAWEEVHRMLKQQQPCIPEDKPDGKPLHRKGCTYHRHQDWEGKVCLGEGLCETDGGK